MIAIDASSKMTSDMAVVLLDIQTLEKLEQAICGDLCTNTDEDLGRLCRAIDAKRDVLNLGARP